jgi:hypothetical protein
MRPSNRIALLALALALAACQGANPPPATPTAVPSGVAAGNAAATNAVPATSPILELKGCAALAVIGAALTPLDGAGETTVHAKATFRVELPPALADARLSLLDAGDAMVPSSGTREVGQATVLTLAPAVALPPGAHLRLRVDGAATRELHAADGRRFGPLEWLVVVAGETEPKKSPGKKGKRR